MSQTIVAICASYLDLYERNKDKLGIALASAIQGVVNTRSKLGPSAILRFSESNQSCDEFLTVPWRALYASSKSFDCGRSRGRIVDRDDFVDRRKVCQAELVCWKIQ